MLSLHAATVHFNDHKTLLYSNYSAFSMRSMQKIECVTIYVYDITDRPYTFFYYANSVANKFGDVFSSGVATYGALGARASPRVFKILCILQLLPA